MRVLRISILREGVGSCRSVDVRHAHSSILGNEIVDGDCLTCDCGCRWHCDPEDVVPVLLDGSVANFLKEGEKSIRLEVVLGIQRRDGLSVELDTFGGGIVQDIVVGSSWSDREVDLGCHLSWDLCGHLKVEIGLESKTLLSSSFND